MKYRNEAIKLFSAAAIIWAAWLYCSEFIAAHIWTCAWIAFLAMVAAWAIAARGQDRHWYLED